MSVKANGSPRIYLPQINAHQTNRGALDRKQDLFKPSQGNPFAYSYGREKSRDQLLQPAGLNSNYGNFQSNSGYPLPKLGKELPKKRKKWGKVIDKRSIEEEKPSKRGSWAFNETHTNVPKLYNPYGSKVRELSFTSFDNPDEESSSFEVSDSFGGSASGRRRKQWSRPSKNIAKQEIPVSIEEENNGHNDHYRGTDSYQGTPRIIYDRHGPVTATYEPSYGGPPVPTNHTPSSHRYHRTPRNRRPGQPPSSDSIGALNTGSTRSGDGEEKNPNINNLLERFASEIDDEAYVNLNRHNKPNLFGGNYRPFYPSPSNFVVSPPPRAKTKAKPVLTDKRTGVSSRPAKQEPSAHSKVLPNVPSANSAIVGKPPIDRKMVKNERKKIISKDAAETRPAKYTYTIENEDESKNVKNSDGRPSTYSKDENNDDDRPAKYTYTIDKDSKSRTVTFQDENKHNTKNSKIKSNKETKSKSAPSNSTEAPSGSIVGASNTTDQSESLSPGRKNWSPPTGELFDEDPRQFWVDMNSKKEGKRK